MQDFVNTLPAQLAPAAVSAAAVAKKQRPVVSVRHTEDDLKSGDYEYITQDGMCLVLSVFTRGLFK